MISSTGFSYLNIRRVYRYFRETFSNETNNVKVTSWLDLRWSSLIDVTILLKPNVIIPLHFRIIFVSYHGHEFIINVGRYPIILLLIFRETTDKLLPYACLLWNTSIIFYKAPSMDVKCRYLLNETNCTLVGG